MKRETTRVILAGALVLAAGCATGPDFKTPAAPASVNYEAGEDVRTAAARGPGGVAQHFNPAAEISGPWWEAFGSGDLNAAVQTALTNSPTLAQALARLRRAQEEYRAASGGLRYPEMEAGLSAARKKVNPEAMGMTGVPEPDPFSLFNASVSVSYAFDLCGKNRRTLEALKAQVDRRDIELGGARQTLAANVVLAHLRLAETEKRLTAAREVVAARQEQLNIARKRWEAGGISASDLELQGLALAQAQATLPSLEQQRGQLGRQLAVYLGREPAEAIQTPLDLDDLRLPEEVPASLPAEVAKQRPDIRAAEAVWRQACANVGVATADLYPRMALTASLGSQTTEAGDLLGSLNVWSVGADLMQPVFHGGELRAKKRAAVAVYDEAAAAYRETVLRGLQEVADALQALQTDARELAARSDAANHARVVLDTATKQQEEGGLSQAALLDAKIRQLQAEGERISAQAARLADTAVLFHALGGRW